MPKVFCSTLMKLYGPGRGPVVRLSRLLRVEGLAIESALFRVGRPLKHRREEFYARRVIQPPARPPARTHATHLLFGSVSSGRAGPVSFGVFDCPHDQLQGVRGVIEIPLLRTISRSLPPFAVSVLQNSRSTWTSALCRAFFFTLPLSSYR